MLATVHQPEHLCWPGLLDKISKADIFICLDNVQFRKNYFQNRNKIIGPNGPEWITIPIKKFSHHTPINKILIDTENKIYLKWLHKLDINYRKFPFHAEVMQLLSSVYNSNHTHLCEFNIDLLSRMLTYIGCKTKIVLASDSDITYNSKTDMHIKLVKSVGAISYLSGPSGKDYLDLDLWTSSKIDLFFHNYTPIIYDHLFSNKFEPGASAIDTMMMLGKDSKHVILNDRVIL